MTASKRRTAAIVAHLRPAIGASSSAHQCSADTIAEYSVEAVQTSTKFAENPETPLSDSDVAHFMVEGYLPLPGLLSAAHLAALKHDVDQCELDRKAGARKMNVEYENLVC